MRICRVILLCCLATTFTAEAAEPTNVSPDALREAVEKSIPLIEKSMAGAREQRKCFTCHHQGLPVLAIEHVRERGFTIDAGNLEASIEHAYKFINGGRNSYESGKGQGGKADTAGYALWTLEASRKPNDTTTAVTKYLLGWQADRDHWHPTSNRPPTEASQFTTTYLALRALHVFGTKEQQAGIDDRTASVRKWLLSAEPKDTEDHVFRLKTFAYIDHSPEERTAAAEALLKLQRDDGGWAQLEKLEPDAYATGTALTALVESGELETTSEAYRRGIAFLLKTQLEDGSWHVVSRSKPFQKHFESGFPHGKDQFISTPATCWAVMALSHALPEISK